MAYLASSREGCEGVELHPIKHLSRASPSRKSGRSGALKASKRSDAGTGDLGELPTHETLVKMTTWSIPLVRIVNHALHIAG